MIIVVNNFNPRGATLIWNRRYQMAVEFDRGRMVSIDTKRGQKVEFDCGWIIIYKPF